ncbi:MAG TPA: hypothetical protein DDY71_11160 [Spirochaetia bacterium]|nr:hypothetical protein [Spirochaetia bacterium]
MKAIIRNDVKDKYFKQIGITPYIGVFWTLDFDNNLENTCVIVSWLFIQVEFWFGKELNYIK